MLSLATGLVFFGCFVLAGNCHRDICPCLVAGQWSDSDLLRNDVFGRGCGIFNHTEPNFDAYFCSLFPVVVGPCRMDVDSGPLCGGENKKSFTKSKKGLSKMDQMV